MCAAVVSMYLPRNLVMSDGVAHGMSPFQQRASSRGGVPPPTTSAMSSIVASCQRLGILDVTPQLPQKRIHPRLGLCTRLLDLPQLRDGRPYIDPRLLLSRLDIPADIQVEFILLDLLKPHD